VRIDADTKPAKKAIMALGAIGSQGGLMAISSALSSVAVPAIAAVTTATFAMANSFAAAGAAAGIFALAVKPQFADISKAMKGQAIAEDAKTKAAVQASLAQDIATKNGYKYGTQVKITSKMTAAAKDKATEYNRALAASGSASKTATKAQALYKQELDAMPPATRKTAEAMQNLKDDTNSWSRSLAATTMPIFTRGINIIRGLLPKLTPIVHLASEQITQFMDNFRGDRGGLFVKFGKNMQLLAGGSLGVLLRSLKNIALGFVGVMNAFAPMAMGMGLGFESLTKKFATFGIKLQYSKGFKSFIAQARSLKQTNLLKTIGDLAKIAITAVQAMGPLAGVSLKIAQAFASMLAALPPAVLTKLVQAIVLANVAFKAYAIYTAAAAGVTWLFSTANGASRVQMALTRIELYAWNIQLRLMAMQQGIAAAATWAWNAALTASTAVVNFFRLANLRAVASVIATRIQIIALAVAQRAAAVASAVVTAATWAWSVAMNSTGIPLLIIAIAALVAAIIWIAVKTTWFQTGWKYTWNAIKVAAFYVWHALEAVWHGITVGYEAILSAAQAVWRWLKSNWPYLVGILGGPFGLAVAYITKHWGQVRDFLISGWHSIYNNVVSPIIHFFTVSIPNAAGHMRDFVKSAFRSMVLFILDRFGDVLHGAARLFGWVPGVGGKLKSAERSFQKFRDNVNKALGGVNGHTVKVPVSFRTIGGTKVFTRASGGAIDGVGTETSDSNLALVSKNEHVWSAKEVRGAGGHGAMVSMRRAAKEGKLPAFAQGGTLGVTTSAPNYKSVSSAMSRAIMAEINLHKKALFNTLPMAMLAGGFAGGGKAPVGGANHWRGLVITMLKMVGQSTGLVNTVLRRMQQESGGNPNIVNKWDSNWKAGHPSVGLMQVIGPTFRAHAGKYLHTGPFLYGTSVNPAANIYASFRYALGRYGSLANAFNRKGGYDLGGVASGTGLFPKMTSAPERVLSPRQTAAFEKSMSGGFGQGGQMVVHIHLENHGVIGSRAELEQWLVDSLDSIGRKHRVPASFVKNG
jgi:SLT domain-containing protein